MLTGGAGTSKLLASELSLAIPLYEINASASFTSCSVCYSVTATADVHSIEYKYHLRGYVNGIITYSSITNNRRPVWRPCES
jgi:hypothetical protein